MSTDTFPIADLRRFISVAAEKSTRDEYALRRDLIAMHTDELLFHADRGDGDLSYAETLWSNDPVQQGRTLIPLLALYHGLDPGPGGMRVAWRPLRAASGRVGWWLSGDDEAVYYVTADDGTADDDEIVDDTIATEPDDLAALVAACKLAISTIPERS